VKPLISLKEKAKFVIGSSIKDLAALAADEMLEIIRDIASAQEGDFRLRLHCISHSMGGLCLRGALPRFFEEACNVEPGIFLTLSTPHLGVQASWGAPKDMWRNYSWALAKALGFSAQVPQFSAKDSTGFDVAGNKCPYLVSLADPAGPYLPQLARFQRRMCVTMASGDIVIPVASGSIWDDRGSQSLAENSENTEGESICAGWGFKAFSRHEPSQTQTLGEPLNSCENATWVVSKDRQCKYLPQVLAGLLTLDWDRLIVKTHLPLSFLSHVFLIGKKEAQYALEHCLARRCIAQLIEMLRTNEDGRRNHVEAPCWQESVVPPQPVASALSFCSGRWVIATEEGCGNFKFYPFENEIQAYYCFDTWHKCARILFNPSKVEMGRKGACAFRSIRRAFFSASDEGIVQTSWTVGAEHGIRNARFYPFETEEHARTFFKEGFLLHARVLFDPTGKEVEKAGLNYRAQRFLVQEFRKLTPL
jgi:hypothetical protein